MSHVLVALVDVSQELIVLQTRLWLCDILNLLVGNIDSNLYTAAHDRYSA